MKNKKSFILISTIILGLSACGSSGAKTSKSTEGSKSNPATSSSVTQISSSIAGNSSSEAPKEYTITYNLDGGTNHANNPSSYIEGTTFTFLDATKNGYSFAGWFDADNKQVNEITASTTGNLSLTAHWTANKYNLSVTSEDETKGTVSITSGSGYADESITVVAKPSVASKFTGWYNGDTKVSSSATYIFTMPKNDYSLVAHFSYDEYLAAKYAMIPTVKSDQTVTYGLYPQTNVNDNVIIGELNNMSTPYVNDYYLYHDELYAKVVATPNKDNYKFDNGNLIVAGNTYWFKCEPITWTILDEDKEGFFVLANVLLDAHYFYKDQEVRNIGGYAVYPNDYEDSDIRAWLNGEFLNNAFGLDSSYVLTTDVDNSAASTHSDANHYWCNDTKDKVFLPSYQDYTNLAYGFTNNRDSTSKRQVKPTDYARARGSYVNQSYSKGYGSYWTRSPDNYYNSSYNVWVITSEGAIGFDGVEYAGDSVRPCIRVKTK